MTEEIIIENAFHLCQRLEFELKITKANYEASEQENKELKEENKTLNYQWHKQSEISDEWYKIAERYRSALEEIKVMINHPDHRGLLNKIEDRINEVLQ